MCMIHIHILHKKLQKGLLQPSVCDKHLQYNGMSQKVMFSFLGLIVLTSEPGERIHVDQNSVFNTLVYRRSRNSLNILARPSFFRPKMISKQLSFFFHSLIQLVLDQVLEAFVGHDDQTSLVLLVSLPWLWASFLAVYLSKISLSGTGFLFCRSFCYISHLFAAYLFTTSCPFEMWSLQERNSYNNSSNNDKMFMKTLKHVPSSKNYSFKSLKVCSFFLIQPQLQP